MPRIVYNLANMQSIYMHGNPWHRHMHATLIRIHVTLIRQFEKVCLRTRLAELLCSFKEALKHNDVCNRHLYKKRLTVEILRK